MGVTDDAAQMDLDLYIGNFDLKSIFLRRTRSGITNIRQKHIDLSITRSSSIRFHGKSEET